ncbi:hypothetical protein TRIP_D300117 [uncultured Paludibacter sp.]|nr:hypothetical protein TRIP_D300117 [uncultured Paludibacter sp.]
MKSYTTLTAPNGKEIRFAFRLNRFLVVMTNFNPFEFKSFAEAYMLSIEGFETLDGLGVYGDNSGYYIFRLKVGYDRDAIIDGIDQEFQKYFTDNINKK